MDFGFKLSKSATIDLNGVDHTAFDRVCEEEPGARLCMACGSCTATCTAGPYSGMSVRKVLLALQRGQSVKEMMACCMLCGKCTMVCPRGINTRHLLLTISKG